MRNTLTIDAAKPSAPQLASHGPTTCRPASTNELGEPHFVFVTRDGRVMARQADGSVTDMTPDEAVRRMC